VQASGRVPALFSQSPIIPTATSIEPTNFMPITPNTLEDFMKLFGGSTAVDEEQVAHYHDRFMSARPEDNQFDNNAYHEAAAQHLATLPDDQFHDAAKNAVATVPPQQRQDLLGGLLSALGGARGLAGALGAMGGAGENTQGGGLAGIAKMLGLTSTDPRQMSNDDAAKVINYARTEHPEVMQQTVAEKPWFMKAMGNPIVMGALAVAAAKLLNNTRRPS
jgi:hypothetical protein